jgi:hypothetical protein
MSGAEQFECIDRKGLTIAEREHKSLVILVLLSLYG